MNVYAVMLTGQGDTDIKLVTPETYNWITANELGRTNNHASSWDDTSCPIEVRKQIWESLHPSEKKGYNDDFNEYYPEITIGSFTNDRALVAPAIKQNNVKLEFNNLGDYTAFIKQHDITIIDTFEGYIY